MVTRVIQYRWEKYTLMPIMVSRAGVMMAPMAEEGLWDLSPAVDTE